MNIDKLSFVTKIGTLIKGATIIQKVGMAATTVAVVGGTAAGIVAANSQTTNVEPRPAAAISQPAKTDETTKPEDAKAEETKAEETTTSEDAKPADETQTSDDSYKVVEEPGRPAKRDWEHTYAEAEEKPAESHDVDPAPAPSQDNTIGGKEKGLQYIVLARGDNGVSYFATYGYEGTCSSRDEAMASVTAQLKEAGITNYKIYEDSRMMIGN